MPLDFIIILILTLKTYTLKKDKDKNKTMKLQVDFDKEKEGLGGSSVRLGTRVCKMLPTYNFTDVQGKIFTGLTTVNA